MRNFRLLFLLFGITLAQVPADNSPCKPCDANALCPQIQGIVLPSSSCAITQSAFTSVLEAQIAQGRVKTSCDREAMRRVFCQLLLVNGAKQCRSISAVPLSSLVVSPTECRNTHLQCLVNQDPYTIDVTCRAAIAPQQQQQQQQQQPPGGTTTPNSSATPAPPQRPPSPPTPPPPAPAAGAPASSGEPAATASLPPPPANTGAPPAGAPPPPSPPVSLPSGAALPPSRPPTASAYPSGIVPPPLPPSQIPLPSGIVPALCSAHSDCGADRLCRFGQCPRPNAPQRGSCVPKPLACPSSLATPAVAVRDCSGRTHASLCELDRSGAILDPSFGNCAVDGDCASASAQGSLSFCKFIDGSCGRAPGAPRGWCMRKPEVCASVCATTQLLGCNGKRYCSECHADAEGTSLAFGINNPLANQTVVPLPPVQQPSPLPGPVINPRPPQGGNSSSLPPPSNGTFPAPGERDDDTGRCPRCLFVSKLCPGILETSRVPWFLCGDNFDAIVTSRLRALANVCERSQELVQALCRVVVAEAGCGAPEVPIPSLEMLLPGSPSNSSAGGAIMPGAPPSTTEPTRPMPALPMPPAFQAAARECVSALASCKISAIEQRAFCHDPSPILAPQLCRPNLQPSPLPPQPPRVSPQPPQVSPQPPRVSPQPPRVSPQAPMLGSNTSSATAGTTSPSANGTSSSVSTTTRNTTGNTSPVPQRPAGGANSSSVTQPAQCIPEEVFVRDLGPVSSACASAQVRLEREGCLALLFDPRAGAEKICKCSATFDFTRAACGREEASAFAMEQSPMAVIRRSLPVLLAMQALCRDGCISTFVATLAGDFGGSFNNSGATDDGSAGGASSPGYPGPDGVSEPALGGSATAPSAAVSTLAPPPPPPSTTRPGAPSMPTPSNSSAADPPRPVGPPRINCGKCASRAAEMLVALADTSFKFSNMSSLIAESVSLYRSLASSLRMACSQSPGVCGSGSGFFVPPATAGGVPAPAPYSPNTPSSSSSSTSSPSSASGATPASSASTTTTSAPVSSSDPLGSESTVSLMCRNRCFMKYLRSVSVPEIGREMGDRIVDFACTANRSGRKCADLLSNWKDRVPACAGESPASVFWTCSEACRAQITSVLAGENECCTAALYRMLIARSTFAHSFIIPTEVLGTVSGGGSTASTPSSASFGAGVDDSVSYEDVDPSGNVESDPDHVVLETFISKCQVPVNLQAQCVPKAAALNLSLRITQMDFKWSLENKDQVVNATREVVARTVGCPAEDVSVTGIKEGSTIVFFDVAAHSAEEALAIERELQDAVTSSTIDLAPVEGVFYTSNPEAASEDTLAVDQSWNTNSGASSANGGTTDGEASRNKGQGAGKWKSIIIGVCVAVPAIALLAGLFVHYVRRSRHEGDSVVKSDKVKAKQSDDLEKGPPAAAAGTPVIVAAASAGASTSKLPGDFDASTASITETTEEDEQEEVAVEQVAPHLIPVAPALSQA